MTDDATSYDHLLVLSDLHLSPRSRLLEFHAMPELEKTLGLFAALGGRGLLVLNGDTLDYLHLPNYREISLTLAAERTRQMTTGLPELIRALTSVLAAGHGILVVPGNHDPELALIDAQDVLRGSLGGPQVEQLRFHLDDGPWRVQVGDTTVAGLHGHLSDGWNRLPIQRMLAAQARGDQTVRKPAGTRLVIDVLNPYRRACDENGDERFKFVDLLKPDLAVLLLLVYVDVELALWRLPAVIRAFAARLADAVGNRLRGAAMMGPGEGEPDDLLYSSLAESIVEVLPDGMKQAPNPVVRAIQDYFDRDAAQPVPGMLAAPATIAREWFLEAFAVQARKAWRAFDLTHEDDTYRSTIGNLPDTDGAVLVTGHTHAARRIERDRGRLYLNSGTWQDMLEPPERFDLPLIEAWVSRLTEGDFEPIRRLTAIRVAGSGAELVEWREALVPLR